MNPTVGLSWCLVKHIWGKESLRSLAMKDIPLNVCSKDSFRSCYWGGLIGTIYVSESLKSLLWSCNKGTCKSLGVVPSDRYVLASPESDGLAPSSQSSVVWKYPRHPLQAEPKLTKISWSSQELHWVLDPSLWSRVICWHGLSLAGHRGADILLDASTLPSSSSAAPGQLGLAFPAALSQKVALWDVRVVKVS